MSHNLILSINSKESLLPLEHAHRRYQLHVRSRGSFWMYYSAFSLIWQISRKTYFRIFFSLDFYDWNGVNYKIEKWTYSNTVRFLFILITFLFCFLLSFRLFSKAAWAVREMGSEHYCLRLVCLHCTSKKNE